MNMSRLLLATTLTAPLFAGCAKNYLPSTNLDSQRFIDYFSPAKVKIYQSEQDIVGRYRAIGLVEGQSCQKKAHHELPNEIDARTNARRIAYQKNANGIVFTGCVLINTEQQSSECINTRVCYGKIFQVEVKKTEQANDQ